jgi:hypothetical protein
VIWGNSQSTCTAAPIRWVIVGTSTFQRHPPPPIPEWWMADTPQSPMTAERMLAESIERAIARADMFECLLERWWSEVKRFVSQHIIPPAVMRRGRRQPGSPSWARRSRA